MTKRVYILLIFMLGSMLAPGTALACGFKVDKPCCKKETPKQHSTEKPDTNDCCKKSQHHSEDKDDCGGKCGDNSCHCQSLNSSFVLPLFFEIGNDNLDPLSEVQKFSHVGTHLASGFCSIWTPPNRS